ncbi:MAG: type II secretion system major pseudopilin GspG [Alphaproteobacteria bacterium]|nr:type II secretion system major pseudopilin GspG [Alphaproteobacteria bacterium]
MRTYHPLIFPGPPCPRPGGGRRSAQASAGFTLLELLIVLVIIGLLAGLVGPRLLERLDSSKVTTTQTQIRELRTALDTLRLDIGRYPTTEEGLALLVSAPTDPQLRAQWRGPYLEDALPDDAWGHPFNYAYSGTGNPPFSLYSYGPEGKPSADGTANKEIGILPKE